MDQDGGGAREAGGVQVIARAAAVLRALGPDGMSLGKLAQATGLPRSTVQRIVDALAAENLVEVAAGGVRPGWGLQQLAQSAHTDITVRARPISGGAVRRDARDGRHLGRARARGRVPGPHHLRPGTAGGADHRPSAAATCHGQRQGDPVLPDRRAGDVAGRRQGDQADACDPGSACRACWPSWGRSGTRGSPTTGRSMRRACAPSGRRSASPGCARTPSPSPSRPIGSRQACRIINGRCGRAAHRSSRACPRPSDWPRQAGPAAPDAGDHRRWLAGWLDGRLGARPAGACPSRSWNGRVGSASGAPGWGSTWHCSDKRQAATRMKRMRTAIPCRSSTAAGTPRVGRRSTIGSAAVCRQPARSN